MDVAHCFDFCSFFVWLFLLFLQMLKLIGFDLGVGVGVQVEVGRKVWIYVNMGVIFCFTRPGRALTDFYSLLGSSCIFLILFGVGAWICAAHLHLFSSRNDNMNNIKYAMTNKKQYVSKRLLLPILNF